MGICFVVGAGDCTCLDFQKKKDDLIIAADGGYAYLKKFGIDPDIVIGDFDSLGYIPEKIETVKLPAEKDVTDMNAAIDLGIERGYSEFFIYGACGGRIDHTLSNIQLVASLAEKNIKVFIRDGKTVITAIHNKKISFDSKNKGYISVFSHSDICKGVTIKGLKYTLENASLSNLFPLGVSNEFTGSESEISVKSGTLVLVYSI